MSKKKIIGVWKSFFKEKGVESALADKYMIYISNLLEKKVPIIFDFNHLALLFGRQPHYLASVVNSPNNHYRHFKIKKRIGGFREISTPFPALLDMQYWIFDNILKKIPIHYCAHGFAYKKSILTNARIHAGQKELLKLDLKDFFPSIKINRIISVFKSLGYPNNISFYLAAICSYNECLPQGAPTSPMLSNIIVKSIDNRLIKLSNKFNLKYTRYADDLTFSGDLIPAKFIEYITAVIEDEGFYVNVSKTRLYKNKSKRIVTGISVIESQLKLPRDYKRNLHQELNFIFKFGIESHLKKKKIRKFNYLSSIIGKVNFWLMVEPNNEFAKTSKQKLIEIYNSSFSLPQSPRSAEAPSLG
jgi:RNA-directed DNA polymerase